MELAFLQSEISVLSPSIRAKKKQEICFQDFLPDGAADRRLLFSFESSGQGDPMMGYFTTQNSYLKSKRTLS